MTKFSRKNKPSNPSRLLRFASIVLVITAVGLAVLQWLALDDESIKMPAGSTIAGKPVGGMNIEDVPGLVETTYLVPLILNYDGEKILVSPNDLGLILKTTPSLEIITQKKNSEYFWDYLWNKRAEPFDIQIQFEVEVEKIEEFLRTEISPRYDIPASAPVPIPGTTRFSDGQTGKRLHVASSAVRVQETILAAETREVSLLVEPINAPVASFDHLEKFLKQKIRAAGFNGIAEIYVQEWNTGQIMHFAVQDGVDLPINIAFSAASTIKIPILLSSLLEAEEPLPALLTTSAERMIVFSENPPADRLMETIIGNTLAPLKVTEDVHALGLENTFLAGYFYLGAPLLQRFETPANTRTDVQLRPDTYNQTTVGDMGKLLGAIYYCATQENGLLIETFGKDITASECNFMIDVLLRNQIGILMEAGVPEGTSVAHKHGWASERDGVVRTISDVGIVFTPGSDFTLIIFLYDPVQLLFDPGNVLVAQLSQVVYNYFNPQAQIDWVFGPIRYR